MTQELFDELGLEYVEPAPHYRLSMCTETTKWMDYEEGSILLDTHNFKQYGDADTYVRRVTAYLSKRYNTKFTYTIDKMDGRDDNKVAVVHVFFGEDNEQFSSGYIRRDFFHKVLRCK